MLIEIVIEEIEIDIERDRTVILCEYSGSKALGRIPSDVKQYNSVEAQALSDQTPFPGPATNKMDKLTENERIHQNRHLTQDWPRDLDEDIDVEELDAKTGDNELVAATVLKRKLLFKAVEDKPPKAVKVNNQFETLSNHEEPMETVDVTNASSRERNTATQNYKTKLPPIVIAGTENYTTIVKTMRTDMINIADSENLEATTVTVNTKNGHIDFVAAYNPPTKILLKTDLDNITTDNHFLVGGDLSSKNTLWNSRTTIRNGRILEEHATETEYNVLAPESPTFYPGNHLHRPDVLDIILINLKLTTKSLTVLQELDSDHNPVLCEWDVDTEHQTNWHKPNIKTTDWTKFKTDLQETIPRNLEIETEEDINVAIYILLMTIQEAYMLHTVTSRKQQNVRMDQPELNFPIAQKREARRDWQWLRTPQERTNYNRLKAQLYPLLKGHQLSQQTKLTIYKGIIQPIILYGCVGWDYAAKTHINKLQTVQNKILRLITGTDIRTRTDHLHAITKSKTLPDIFKENRKIL
uniref:(California timema) hypothetical protein n=1 Tax=Timema californicum TaxID=61474 RepID=A0A7R9J104_TIMCA|nr:unnamed protein product [Timema californicum]